MAKKIRTLSDKMSQMGNNSVFFCFFFLFFVSFYIVKIGTDFFIVFFGGNASAPCRSILSE